MLSAVQNVLRLLMLLITHGVDIIARRGDDEHQRLLPGITGTFGQDIEQLIIGLCVQFIKTQTVDGKTMLAGRICR